MGRQFFRYKAEGARKQLATLFWSRPSGLAGNGKDTPRRRTDERSVVITQRELNMLVVVSCATAAIAGLISLMGWATGVYSLTHLSPRFVSLKANTAVCLVFLAASLSIQWHGGAVPGPSARIVAAVLTVIVMLIAGLTLSEYILDRNLGIDELLFSEEPDPIDTLHPGRPAANTSLVLCLLGSALFLPALSRDPASLWTAQTLSLAGGLVAWGALLGYAYDTTDFSGLGRHTRMAPHTSLILVLFSTATVFSKCDGAFPALLLGGGPGSAALRRLVPTAVLAAPALGFLQLRGQVAGLYPPTAGVIIMVLATTLMIIVASILVGIPLNAADSRLTEREGRFRTTLETMQEGYQIVGFDWRYLFVNDAFVVHSRHKREDLMRHTVIELYPGIETTPIYNVYLRCFRERIPIRLENEFVFPDGHVGWFDLMFQPVPEGIAILSIDITERKQAEQTVRQLNTDLERRVHARTEQLEEANKDLEGFSYSVSHDLRTPLRAIDGFSSMLLKHHASQLDDEGRRLLGVVKKSTVRMGELIDDILEFSRAGRRELARSPVDLNALIHTVWEDIEGVVRGQRVELNLHPLPLVQGDAGMLRQVLTNLLSNAVKFTRDAPAPRVEVGVIPAATEHILFVRDNGAGFDQAYVHKLFGVFQRLHGLDEFEGTGIGLAIVKRVISRHGGRVWAEGRVNNGATIYCALPKDLST